MNNTQLTESLLSAKEADNIKVYLRVRPLNAKETAVNTQSLLTTSANTVFLTRNKEERHFTYDHVFDEQTTQEQIFKELGGGLVEQFMEGYNCSVFAYGQTGAGKTFTMLGENSEEVFKGLKPRCLEYFFYLHKQRLAKDSESLIKITYVEIYNERIIDLLTEKPVSLNLREDIQKGVFVENVKEVVVKSFADVNKLVEEGLSRRHVSSTDMNEQSSRSHSIFTVHFQTREKKDECSSLKTAKFNFIDLAGSERQKLTKTVGERFKEGCKINKSLAVLGNVINALAENGKKKMNYVRYRDSKLTFLLKNSLGGNSKTAFIANVSPSSSYVIETLSTLTFAQRAKMIMNVAKVNENVQSESMAALKNELEKTKNLYNRLKGKYKRLEDNGYISKNKDVKNCEKCRTTSTNCNNKVLQMNSILKESMIVLNKSLEKWEEQVNGDMFLKKDEDLIEVLRRNCISIRQLISLINVDTIRRENKEESNTKEINTSVEECLAMLKLFELQKKEMKDEIKEYEEEVNDLKKSVNLRLSATSVIDKEFTERHIDIETFNQHKKDSQRKYNSLAEELERIKSRLVIKENECQIYRMEIEGINNKNQGLIEINEIVRKEKKETIEQLENSKYEKFNLISKFDKEINGLKEMNDKISMDLKNTTQERDILKTSIYTIKSDNELYKEEICNLKKKIETLNKKYEITSKENKDLTTENIELTGKKNTILRDYNQLLKRTNKNNSENFEIKEDFGKFQKSFKRIMKKYVSIGKEVDLLGSHISQSKDTKENNPGVLKETMVNGLVGIKRESIKSLDTSQTFGKNLTRSVNFLHTSQEFKLDNKVKLKKLTKKLKHF